jgi:LCP family protein required for cell wall assembly
MSDEKKREERPTWLRVVAGAGYCLFLAFALFAGALYGWIGRSQVISSAMSIVAHHTPPREVFGSDHVTILLLGCDEDLYKGGYKKKHGPIVERSQARSDMMLVARIDFANKRITGVSIPRDTVCELPGYKPQKINAYHAIAKPGQENELTKQAVEFLLPGVAIDTVAAIDYDAFQKMVNMVGGVHVDIDRRMKYTDRAGGLFINFRPGKNQLLDGYQAMCYVRYRHGDSDFKRQERQKQFLIDLKNAVLAKPLMIGDVADQAVATLGGGLTAQQLASLALFAKDVPEKNIQMGQVPVLPDKGTDLRIDTAHLQQTLQQFGLVPSAG